MFDGRISHVNKASPGLPPRVASTKFSQPRGFEDWATRHAMEKLVNSETAALHGRNVTETARDQCQQAEASKSG